MQDNEGGILYFLTEVLSAHVLQKQKSCEESRLSQYSQTIPITFGAGTQSLVKVEGKRVYALSLHQLSPTAWDALTHSVNQAHIRK
jgi:hypothetical protein